MQDIGIRWVSVEAISNAAKAVVSGDVTSGDASDDKSASREPTLKWTDKPIIVYVCDEAEGCEAFDKIEEIVLKDEKVALGMKAFRTLKMHPDDVENDPLLKDEGKGVPRMIFIEPTKMKFRILEPKKVKASALFSAMKKTAKGFWKESLEKVVKSHLKLMVEQDKLANEIKTLEAKKGRLDEDEERKAKEIADEIADAQKRRGELRVKKTDLWKLTPKKTA